MSLELILFGILPVLFFVFIDMRYGMKAGIYAAIASVVVVLFWLYMRTNQIDSFVIFDGVLLCGLGLLSIKLNNPRYFKFQPLVVGCILGAYTAYFQFFSEPLIIHYIPTMQALADPGTAKLMSAPEMHQAFSVLSGHLAILFFAHAIFCGLAALRWSNVVWMGARLSIYPALILLFFFDCFEAMARVMQSR